MVNICFMPCSPKYLIKAEFLGMARWACSNLKPPFFSSPAAINFFASANAKLNTCFCAFTNFSILGFNAKNCWSSPLGTGPEIINGVLASSTKTESTSSTIAKWCLR